MVILGSDWGNDDKNAKLDKAKWFCRERDFFDIRGTEYSICYGEKNASEPMAYLYINGEYWGKYGKWFAEKLVEMIYKADKNGQEFFKLPWEQTPEQGSEWICPIGKKAKIDVASYKRFEKGIKEYAERFKEYKTWLPKEAWITEVEKVLSELIPKLEAYDGIIWR